MIPEHLQSLHAAYVEVTGIAVSMRSYDRQQSLVEIHERGLTADDIRAVMRELKRLVDSRDPRNECYTPACLEWRNAMGGVDRLEDRAARLKQSAKRKEAAMHIRQRNAK